MRVRVLAVAAAAAALIPTGLAAQACLGLPSADGQLGVAGTGTFVNGDFELGGEFHVDVTGPASFRVGYDNGHLETFATTEGDVETRVGRGYSALGSYELFLLDPSICALGGVTYATDAGPGIDDRFGVALGFGLGKTLEAESFSATIYATPRYLWVRESTVLDETVDSNEFMAEAGVTFGFFPFFVGGGVTLSTIDDGDPGLRFRAGILF